MKYQPDEFQVITRGGKDVALEDDHHHDCPMSVDDPKKNAECECDDIAEDAEQDAADVRFDSEREG